MRLKRYKIKNNSFGTEDIRYMKLCYISSYFAEQRRSFLKQIEADEKDTVQAYMIKNKSSILKKMLPKEEQVLNLS